MPDDREAKVLPPCPICVRRGLVALATHRLVARARAVERDASGNQHWLYADFPDAIACRADADEIMAVGYRKQSRLLIQILSGLQQAAKARGLTYALLAAGDAVFDWGFADIPKPLWLVTAEFDDLSLRADGKTEHLDEASAKAEAAKFKPEEADPRFSQHKRGESDAGDAKLP